MYLSVLLSIFGILLIFGGIAGFLPGFTQNNLLLGFFYVDIYHNVANLILGVIALLCALKYKSNRLFFQVFGIIYGLLSIAGFIWGEDFYFTKMNMADNLMHLVVAILFLILGFSASKEGQV